MVIRLLRTFVATLGLLLGYEISRDLTPLLLSLLDLGEQQLLITAGNILGAILFGLIFYLITPYIIGRLLIMRDSADAYFQKISVVEMLISVFGLIAGLIIANLLAFALLKIPVVGSYLPIVVNILLGYIGMHIAWKKRGELVGMLPRLKNKERSDGRPSSIKLLDTSAIIDGRIADICSAGFIEGVIGIPSFVLKELRHIADSSDPLRRNRGRRGLDILNRMQKELGLKVQIFDKDFDDIYEVDSKLVRLAKVLNAKVVTNDYNLNKVCALQNVPVLNINELANAVKPVVLPGEEMQVRIVKEGKEVGQGVGYLEDGTMIVVDNARRFINQEIKVIVTSVLQTAAGRMIFAKTKGVSL